MEAAGSRVRRVLMTADTVGGVWTYALELTRALAPSGLEVALATLGAPLTPAQWQEAQSLSNLTVFESRYKLEWMDDPWDDVERAGAWLLELAARWQPEVIHLNGYAHGALPWPAPVLICGHSCVLSWWRAVKGEPAPARWERYRQAVAAGLHAANLVVTPTAAMLGALNAHYGPLPASRVIPNGRAAQLFTAAKKQDFILTAGRLWDEGKNVAALQAVAPALPWPVYVAGETQFPDAGDEPAENASAPPNMKLLGRLASTELAHWLGQAAIFALPARYEPFGLTALEAGLANCALVLGDLTSLREVWGEAALYVPPDDHAALQRILQHLIADAAQRRALAQRARVRALEYTPELMATLYRAAYDELHEHRQASSPQEARCAS
jgi:glycogen synthase